ncbi:ABC transporter permease [Campylobacter sp. MIT 99-7217]|uniref:ABC transporter permease n=1 Tax=Campylobacter sp. MIT 99-7217 TaxID=535091 RepID=UPI00115B5E2C|nr:ABC transporter permease [Campylobacter sp. MIT 99-7217]TQR29523.1 ABC transporter permease [Campylobacter sp. MIT 99-7217]
MQFIMIKNSIFKNKIQKSLAFLTCFLATALLCAMLNITLGIGNEITKELRSYGSNILVLPKGSSLSIEVGNEIYEPLKNENYLEESNLHKIKEIFWRNNITAFAPFLEGKATWNRADQDPKEALIMGTYFDKSIEVDDEDDFSTGVKRLYTLWSVEGEWAKDDSLDEIMLGDEFAKENMLKVGDIIFLNDQQVRITAIISHAQKASNKIITSLALAQKLLNKQGLFDKAEVSALTIPEDDLAQKARRDQSSLDQLEYDKWFCTAYVGSIAHQIEEDFKGSAAKPQTSISDAESFVVKKIQSLMGLTSVICLIVASIAIAALMSSEIHRRKKEIGLLKVLGANAFQIYMLFVSENLFVCIFASIFGFAFGILTSELIALSIFNHSIEISFIALPLSIVFAVLIVLVGCLFPMRNISFLQPAEVLCGK